MKNSRVLKSLSVFLIVTLIIGLTSLNIYAHAMFLTEEGPGVLKAEYDGGGISPRTEITIYDAEGNELASGKVDEEGIFEFDKDLDWAKATAQDGMGHSVEIERGVEQTKIPKLPVIIVVAAIVGFILYRSNKKKQEQ